MGCDIHLVVERRHGDKWIAINTFASHYRAKWALTGKEISGYSSPVARDRNYQRFAKLAGVRGPGPEPRGLPADASDTSLLLSAEDAHSHSWLPLAAAAEVWKQTETGLDEIDANWPESYFFGVDVSGGSGEKIDDYRLIFWFDN
jgi:hypothetical protein